MSAEYVIEVNDLKKYFPLRDGLFGQQTGEVRAVDGVSFNIRLALFLAWSANPAAAKLPSDVRYSGCTTKPRAA